ncbi:MAG: TIGR04086 family membrane protein [Clostridia bacterium]|nr:TIGR04086 family membrane protein [Clostridia bacterium]
MQKKTVVSFFIATLCSAAASVAAVLIFSLVVTLTGLSDSFITPVNYVIRLLSIVFGAFLFAAGEKGILKGALLGLGYFLVTNLVFSLISSNFNVSVALFIELIYCLIVGAIAGVLAVNIKKR